MHGIIRVGKMKIFIRRKPSDEGGWDDVKVRFKDEYESDWELSANLPEYLRWLADFIEYDSVRSPIQRIK